MQENATDKLIEAEKIDADAAYGTVNLHFFQNAIVRKEVIADYVVSGYNLTFTERLQSALVLAPYKLESFSKVVELFFSIQKGLD